MIRTKMKLGLVVFGFVALLGLGQDIVEEIVAIVNEDIITLSQFKKEYEMRTDAARAQLQGEQLDRVLAQIRSELLDSLITDLLVLQMAREKNLNVNDQVKAYMDNLKKQYSLETDEDLKRAVQSQNMDWEVFRKQIEENALRQVLIFTEVGRSIALDESEIVDYYKKHSAEFIDPEEYTVRAVYLSVGAADLDQRKKDVDAKLASGGDFADVAGTFSDEPLKDLKGDLGTLKKNEMDKTLLEAVEKLKKGEVSPWIQAKAGWYLLKLENKKDNRVRPFDEVRKAIEEKLYTDKQTVKVNEFLSTIKKKSYVKILKPDPLGFNK
jgi:peptidyl-prolyl cis-trans isomerase SurA